MTTKRTAREFWIESPQEGNRAYSFKSVSPVGEQIHVREVLPDEISDTERFEFMLRIGINGMRIIFTNYNYAKMNGKKETIREAIDAAIREGKRK